MPRLDDDSAWLEADPQTIMRKVGEVVAEASSTSLLFNNDELNQVPQFDRSEVITGRVVGRGTYGVVREIQSFNLIASNGESALNDTSNNRRARVLRQSSSISRSSIINSNECDLTTREILARRVWSRKGNKYVLKEIERSLLQTDRVTFLKGMIDLALEVKFLGALNHPHAIKLRGLSSKNPANDMSYFVILEHLEETLSKRLNAWMQQKRATRGLTGILTGVRLRSRTLLTERILVAYDVADVMNYLHCRDIIYRDLKPDNIGFTKYSELKLFDFGLAKELHERDRRDDGTYQLTGLTGAVRYMAPEVGLRQPYNLKADVYSWSMLMWHIMALEPPFGLYTANMFLDRVFSKQYRPAIIEKWPTEVSSLMRESWDSNIDNRPSFKDIMERLQAFASQVDPEVASFMRSSITVTR